MRFERHQTKRCAQPVAERESELSVRQEEQRVRSECSRIVGDLNRISSERDLPPLLLTGSVFGVLN